MKGLINGTFNMTSFGNVLEVAGLKVNDFTNIILPTLLGIPNALLTNQIENDVKLTTQNKTGSLYVHNLNVYSNTPVGKFGFFR